jgi:hypothetical protein
MQISIQKIKDKSTGGKPHIEGEYCQLIFETRDGFTGYWDTNGDNPMYTSLQAKKVIRSKVDKGVSFGTLEEAFG